MELMWVDFDSVVLAIRNDHEVARVSGVSSMQSEPSNPFLHELQQ